MITYRTVTFSFGRESVRIAGWFLFNRWALLRYVFVEESIDDAADAH